VISGFWEGILQKRRFSQVKGEISGSVLDFGGNYGELGEYLKLKDYHVTNGAFSGGSFDTIVLLAVLEHLERPVEILLLLRSCLKPKGRIVITTPTPLIHPLLVFLSWFFLDKKNIEEHFGYYTKEGLKRIGESLGMKMRYKRFQLGLNQRVVYEFR